MKKLRSIQLKKNNFMGAFLSLLIAMPIFITIFYELPGGDDFTFLNSRNMLLQNYNYIQAVFIHAINYYFSWQGNYSTNLFFAMTPYWGGTYLWLRLAMVVELLLFLCGLKKLIYKMSMYLFEINNESSKLLLFLLVEILFLNGTNSNEIFLWYSGSVTYLLPIIFYFFHFIYLLNLFYEEVNKKNLVLASVFGFLGSGGSLLIVGFGCAASLSFYIFEIIRKKNCLSKKELAVLAIPLAVTVAGALIDALAPGNFVRHDEMNESSQLAFLYSLRGSILSTGYNGLKLLGRYGNLFILVCIFLVALFSSKKRSALAHILLICICGIFTSMAACFPVLLGYGTAIINESSSNRIYWSVSFTILAIYFVCALELAAFIKSIAKVSFTWNKKIYGILGGLLAIIFCLNAKQMSRGMIAQLASNLANGDIQETSRVGASIYAELRKNEGSDLDVIITRKAVPNTVMYASYLTSDSEHWLNQSVAEYFGLSSVTMVWE